MSVWVVDLGGEDAQSAGAMDLELYQSLIDQLAESKATLFLTLNRTPLPTGLWNVGLRRAGEAVDVGVLGQRLGSRLYRRADLGFETGGGHPYAAGAQCGNYDLSADAVCQEVVRICEGMLTEGEDLKAFC